MKRIVYVLLLIIPLHSCISQKNQNIRRQLDRIVQKYVDFNKFMGSVLVAKNGEVLLKEGYGFADIGHRIKNKPSTNYYLASVSKLFTAAAIIELKNKGLLGLDDTLTKYIPDYPGGNRITIRHLIQHRSGIVDFVNERPYELLKSEIKIDDIINKFKYLPLNFEPGEKYSYSGSGYILLAYIIEKVSGMSYSDYIEKNIFNKLEMNSSVSDWNHIPKNQAKGYYKENGNYRLSDYFSPSQFVGAGNLTSTVEDLYKWYNAIYKTNKISLECQTDHLGRIGGWTSTDFYPVFSSDYAIIILSNYGDAPVVDIAKEIRYALDNDREKYQKVNASSLDKYCGYYSAGDRFYMIIEKGNNCLISFANDNSGQVVRDTVYKVAEDEFKHPNMRLTFNDKNNNSYENVFAFWGVEGYLYKRASFSVDNRNAYSYSGVYKLDNNDIVTISSPGKDLTIKIEKPDGTVILFPARGINRNKFIYKYGIISFESSDNEIFNKIMLVEDGKEVNGVRR